VAVSDDHMPKHSILENWWFMILMGDCCESVKGDFNRNNGCG